MPNEWACADSRIVNDVPATAQGFADCFSDILFAATTGGFYAVSLYRLYGAIYAAAPFTYLLLSFIVVDVLTPVRKTWRRLEKQRWSVSQNIGNKAQADEIGSVSSLSFSRHAEYVVLLGLFILS